MKRSKGIQLGNLTGMERRKSSEIDEQIWNNPIIQKLTQALSKDLKWRSLGRDDIPNPTLPSPHSHLMECF